MDKIKTFLVFSKVAELLSFTKAADVLNLPRATVTTTVQNLEARLRVQLLNRTTRSVSLTLEGEVFLERCRQVLNDVDELEKTFQVSTSKLSGRIRVDMPVNFAREFVIPRLQEFYETYPDIQIELSSNDSFIDVVAESADLVVRSGEYSDSNFNVLKLMDVRMGNYASPKYLEQFGVPTSLESLKSHYFITYSHIFGKDNAVFYYEKDDELCAVPVKSRLSVNSTVSYTEACIGGLGISQLPTPAVQKYVDNGTLIEVLQEYRMSPRRMDLIHLKNKKVSNKVLVFIHWLESITRLA
ncbi:DNA-binding transcriptional LysR family regulator [Alteromonadaceae bacterium 2753L.S.0a.02]|nr:DNA-binding transcriptional LysR family regulator [Alteromonadaceae bacterium 2753L.S.0a.02]